jgi:membrane-associated phospholipid phosphatase
LIALVYLVLFIPEKLPYGLMLFALVGFSRAFFISFTNLAPPSDIIFLKRPELVDATFRYLFMKSDLFFSGHVANAFMAFLLLKDFKVKWLILFGTVLMGVTVLLMHIHYSIDVFAAFFITYGLYKIGEGMMNKLNIKFKKASEKFHLFE